MILKGRLDKIKKEDFLLVQDQYFGFHQQLTNFQKTGPGIFAKKDDVPGPGQYNVNTSTITNKGVTITGKRKEIGNNQDSLM